MKLYDRYINGEEKTAYDELCNLGENAFNEDNLFQTDKILTETFKRTAYNLDIIYQELLSIGYLFKKKSSYNSEEPLLKPLENTPQLLAKLEEKVSVFGYLPLSLKYFYSIVGSVNFTWDYETNEDFIWDCADPIQVFSLDDLLSYVNQDYWREDIQQYVDDPNFSNAFLEISADYLHKDNISGGAPYSIQITKNQSIDSRFLNEPNKTTFINYLRICFDNCGFSRISNSQYHNDYKYFFDKVKPRLLKI